VYSYLYGRGVTPTSGGEVSCVRIPPMVASIMFAFLLFVFTFICSKHIICHDIFQLLLQCYFIYDTQYTATYIKVSRYRPSIFNNTGQIKQTAFLKAHWLEIRGQSANLARFLTIYEHFHHVICRKIGR